MASAAVLAIFMGGLGIGSLLLGKRADRASRPIQMYSWLELGITCSAAISPFLLDAARFIFVHLGGGFACGPFLGTVIRLALSTLILLAPTILMGGTLPAMARAAETLQDVRRTHLAFLYGMNTLGAVAGICISNFMLFEYFGNRVTLWYACLINGLVVMVARNLSRSDDPASGELPSAAPAEITESLGWTTSRRRYLIAGAAAVVGFAFLFMELIWYRMLGPILGGTTFTFAIILSVALLGIGLGGLLYPAIAARIKPTLLMLSITCASEAILLAIPFAAGDRIAELAWMLKAAQTFGFYGQVGGWMIICLIVVFPASLLAGIQFPLLIALLGEGKREVGKDTGLVYLANTLGSIAGSLAGGFGFLPLLSATGAWRAVVIILAILSVVVLLQRKKRFSPGPILLSVAALALLLLPGPSALWRHSGIGAGRAGALPVTANELIGKQKQQGRNVVWQRDGVESSVALLRVEGYSFSVNGKIDGNIYADTGTQIMGGMLPAMLAQGDRHFCVIGLGTGSTAGWLAALPTTERVDTIELEPDIARVARDCAAANRHALDNPKLRLIFGDGREWLLTTSQRYDLIFSEPSNPYRAGIASLFTKEFYEAAKERLNEGGIFAQWVQAYEIDAEAVCSIYTTLYKVFPSVETWQTQNGDMLLLGSMSPKSGDLERIRRRMAEPVCQQALVSAWRTDTLSGILARYVGGNTLGKTVAQSAMARVNTDDRNGLEFAFARSVGKPNESRVVQLRTLSRELKDTLPSSPNLPIDVESVERQTVIRFANVGSQEQQEKCKRSLALTRFVMEREFEGAEAVWMPAPWEPTDLFETSMLAFALAGSGNPQAEKRIEDVAKYSPAEAAALRGIYAVHSGKKTEDAAGALCESFTLFRTDPWADRKIMEEAIQLAIDLSKSGNAVALKLYDALSEPFAVARLSHEQQLARLRIASATEPSQTNSRSLAMLGTYEPFPIWDNDFLLFRLRCYTELLPSMTSRAQSDWQLFFNNMDLTVRDLVKARQQEETQQIER